MIPPNPSDASEVVTYFASAATIVQIQRWLKGTGVYAQFVAAFPGSDKWAHWFIAGIASVIASAGIHIVWNWDVIKGGQAVITIPDLMTMVHGVLDWFKVYILQHTIHQAVRTPDPTNLTVVNRPINQSVTVSTTAPTNTPKEAQQ